MLTGSELQLDGMGQAVVINTTAVETSAIGRAMEPQYKAVADTLSQWVERISGNGLDVRRRRRVGGLVDRDRWLLPQTAYDRMRLARQALSDDIVGGAADGSEAFALSDMGVYCSEEDQEDVWNQIAADLNFDDQMRKAWRVLFADSQFVCVLWWDHKDYTPRGNRNSAPKRTKFKDLVVPVGMTFLDTTKVAPVGNLMFGQERLAYVPDPMEAIRIDQVLANRDGEDWTMPKTYRTAAGGRARVPAQLAQLDALELDDPLIEKVIVQRYEPDWTEARLLQDDGVDISNLFLLNPNNVFRHCLTRPDFQRFSDIRLDSVMELLDMKSQLRQLDRTTLIGGSHFILLITKGSDTHPAQQPEIDALQANAITLASIPVIVGDHRLKVEIITPTQDHTLDRSKADNIDVRLFARAWNTFVPTGADRDDPLKTAKVIAKNLESRRKMMARTIERQVFQQIRDRNPGQMVERAEIVFTPAQIALSYDPAFASFILDLRASNEISRETTLGLFDISQAEEKRKREREAREYDATFQTQDPHGTPNPMNDDPANQTPEPFNGPGGDKARQRAAGRHAGGGGTADGSGRGQAARRPRHLANPDSPVQKAIDSLLEARRPALLDTAKELRIVGRDRMRNPELRKKIRDVLAGRIFEDELEIEEDEDE